MDYYYITDRYCTESGGIWGRWRYLGDSATFNFRLSQIFYKPTDPTPTTVEPPTITTANPNVELGTTPIDYSAWYEANEWYDDYYRDDDGGWVAKPKEWHQPAGFEIHFRCVDDPWHNPTTTTQPTTEPPITTTTEPKTTLNFHFVNGLDKEYLINIFRIENRQLFYNSLFLKFLLDYNLLLCIFINE